VSEVTDAAAAPPPPPPPPPQDTVLGARLAEAEWRAYCATTRAGELQAEIQRLNDWRRLTVGAVVAIALFAILMLGIVAFKIADTTDDDPIGALGVQLTERVVPRQ
jgi:hypothetical protein